VGLIPGRAFAPRILGSLTPSEASWRVEYPASQVFADECETLLEFLKERDALGLFLPRLRARQQQRDEALNEIRVANFLHSRGCPVVDWEPIDVGERKLEYAVAIPNQRMLVEVKSPGWEAKLIQRLAIEHICVFNNFHRINKCDLSKKSVWAAKAGFVSQLWHSFFSCNLPRTSAESASFVNMDSSG